MKELINMHPQKKEELLNKGWHEAEIKKAEAMLEQTEHKDIYFSKIIFWSALVVIIFANLIVSLILIPFLIVLNKWLLYLLTVILAGTVGFLYNFLVLDIGHLEKKHHTLAAIIVPLLALTNMVIMVLISNQFIKDLKVQNTAHNPWIMALVFGVAFISPYLIDKLRGKHHLTK